MPIPKTKILLSPTIAAGGGFTLLPEAAGDLSATPLAQVGAHSVASATDLNGDGFADLILGAPGSNDKAVDAGRVYVTLGAPLAASVTGVAHGTPGVVIIDGVSAGDMAGFAVGSIADMNHDLRAEILVGAPGMAVAGASDAGAGFVLWGRAASGGIDLGDPFTANGGGFAIKGQVAGDMAGWAMTSVWDLNGDGTADVLIGAPGQDAGGAEAGAAYVVWGKASGASVLLNTVAAGTGGFKITGAAAGERIGEALASLADQGGDGKAEILLGSAAALGGAGRVYVVDGKATGATVNLADVAAGIGGYVIEGAAGEAAGRSVADAGDVNGDGRHDILIGAGNSAYLVYGQAGHAAVNLADVAAGLGGFRIVGEAAGDLSDLVVLGGQDLNRDGVDDVVIGASHNAEGGMNAGAVYVIWGGSSRPVTLAEVAQGIGGAKVVGAAGSLTGASLAFAGDLNGDGTLDLVMGAPGTGARVQVLYTPTTWQPDANIYGTAGGDLIGAGYGGVLHSVGAGGDAVLGLDGSDTIDGGAGNDTLEGGAGNDLILGDLGDDRLDGGTGRDTLTGGEGNDLYIIGANDRMVEAVGAGTDTVQSSVNATLSDNVENLRLTGTAIRAIGNALDNVLTGNALDNVLTGLAGADTMIGGLGNDIYDMTDPGDVVREGVGAGFDTVRSTINYTLKANVEVLILLGTATTGIGNGLNNHLTGNDLNNTLNGAAGVDTAEGGLGDDTYRVDNSADQVIETAGGGNDTIVASADYVLGAEVETLILTGAAHHGTGNALDNRIIGTALADTLDGGAGVDRLVGGAGDDTYLADNAADRPVETATGGTDTVIAAVDYTLGAYVENLILTGAAHHGTGNAAANHLTGTALADTLDGGRGADVMEGGAGNDTFVVDNTHDVVIEAEGGGIDTVEAKVSYALGAGVENLTLLSAGLKGTGNGDDNHLTGSAGDDTLVGLGGNDTLDGGSGHNRLVGGAGDDTYVLNSAGDVAVEGAGGGNDTAILMVDGLTVGANIETIRLGGSAHKVVGGATDNHLVGAASDDDLDGGAGNDLLSGGDGNDDLRAHSGHDTLDGGAGDDTYHISGASVDVQDFLGHNSLDTSDSTGNDHIDLSGETDSEVEHKVVHISPGGTVSGPMDVQFLQDRSGSFADDIVTVQGLVPQVVAALTAVQPNVEFGVSSFIDKPIAPFGDPGEWVYKQEQGLSASSSDLATTYNAITTLSGADEPEAQLEALMQLALHTADIGFRLDSARFVVLFTDAPFHVAGDGAAAGITTANNGDAVLDGGGLGEDYPMIAQLKSALEAANIIPIFAIAIANGYESTYQDLATQLGRGSVVTLTADSSNIVAAITAGLTAATTTHIADATAGAGDDTVLGGAEDNSLWGNAGNDSLDGRSGQDHLYGGLGDDVLTGGAGIDVLSGGLGSDSFVFASAAESTGTAGDTITDFASGQDKVDLSLFDADTLSAGIQHFAFLGTSAFNALAGELRLSSAAGFTQLLGDTNGDGTADFVLTFDLAHGNAPSLADLVL